MTLGTALVTLFKNILPFKRRGVFFFRGAPGRCRGAGMPCFLRIELVLPTFLPFPAVGVNSLQHKIIFSKRKTWYSRSISDLVTVKMSSRRREPKLEI